MEVEHVARKSPAIARVSRRLARFLPTLTPAAVAAGIVDAVERDRRYATIPKRLGSAIRLRDLPSSLQDLAFIGLKSRLDGHPPR